MSLSPRLRLALTAIALGAVVLLAFPAAASACPNCKDAVTNQSSESFGYAIYAMLASVFGIAGGITWAIIRTARRAAAADTTV